VLYAIGTEILQIGDRVRRVRSVAKQLLPNEPDIEKLFGFEDAVAAMIGFAAEFGRDLQLAGGALLSLATREGNARARYARRLERFFSDLAGGAESSAAVLLREQEKTPLDWFHEVERLGGAAHGIDHIMVEFLEWATDQYELEQLAHS
jgi:hypothetical protein